MSYIAASLKFRIQILQGINTPTDEGGFSRSYKRLIRLWSWKKSLSNYIQAIRSINTDKGNIDTDEFGVRYCSVVSKFYRAFSYAFSDAEDSYKSDGMGKSFDCGFDNNFDSYIDIYPVKCDWFIFLEEGDPYRGRLYKINKVVVDDDSKQFVIIRCKEIEEKGMGATA